MKKLNITFLLLILLLTLFSMFSAKNNQQIIKTISKDLDGDNIEDSLNIINKNNTYIIEILTKTKKYTLNSKSFNNFGSCLDDFDITISFFDITRDNLDEIFIQSSIDHSQIQFIFSFDGKNFIEIHSNENYFYGIFDRSNNKSEKLITATLEKNKISLNSYIYYLGCFKNYNLNSHNILGCNNIYTLIRFIENINNISEIPNIFHSNFNFEQLKPIYSYVYSNPSHPLFQNGIFFDKTSDEYGNIIEAFWSLNFRYSSKENESKSEIKTINILLLKDINDEFMISNISIK